MNTDERQKPVAELDGSDVADHRAEKREAAQQRELARAKEEGLTFLFGDVPEGDKAIEVADGIY